MTAHPSPKAQRLEGFDVARALAILGMTLVHFMLVMTDGVEPERWSDCLLAVLDGRPAATFVILAGIGVSLLSRRASASLPDRAKVGTTLRRRGLFLLGCGFVNLMIWHGDILRLYGISLLLIPWLIWRKDRFLWGTAFGFVAAFCVLLATIDYDQNWDWSTMTYHHLWTASGLVRSLFYDGFRSVFPWTGLLVFGIWLGRLDWSSDSVPRKAIGWGLAMIALSTGVSGAVISWLGTHPQPGLDHQTAVALFGLASMPPLPLFLLNAIGCALLVIGGCTLIARRWPNSIGVRALAVTGQMAFTWYVAHIVLGLGGVILIGWLGTTHLQALLAGLAFFALAVVSSIWLRRRFSKGPLEAMLRSLG